MRSLLTATLITLAPCAAMADKLGDHPAIVVQRLQASQGYDYASKFYPHPAWMYLAAEAPRPTANQPAAAVAKRDQHQGTEPEHKAAVTVSAAGAALNP